MCAQTILINCLMSQFSQVYQADPNYCNAFNSHLAVFLFVCVLCLMAYQTL